jgi:hypothetical protein
MPKATTDPAQADAVRHWPLVLGLCLLAVGAVWNLRVGKDGIVLVLVCAAVVIPGIGLLIRAYLRLSRPAPRVRRVVVTDNDESLATVTLESAKYLTPAPQPGLRDRASDEDATPF